MIALHYAQLPLFGPFDDLKWSGWQTTLAIIHSDDIPPGVKSSGWHNVQISKCNPDDFMQCQIDHDDVINWKHFTRYWPFVRGIHRSPVNSPHKGQWRGALMFSLIYARIKGRVNNDEAVDLRRHRAHYDVTVMTLSKLTMSIPIWRAIYTNYCHSISDNCNFIISLQ